MANESASGPQLQRILLVLDLLILSALALVGVRQTEQARQAQEERRLARELRSVEHTAEGATARYSGLTVEVELVAGDQVLRAAVQVEDGEPPSSWIGKLDGAVRGLEVFK
jgi:hypothetical protein